ncbi:hypothetical protein EDD16DRAFT_1633311 [Pisolithus croceorrhizus]|nr:hypothetical protein EDD16DRAFT_1633311 [Pisolithus croceorrhizus]
MGALAVRYRFFLGACDVDGNILRLGKTGASLAYTSEQGMDPHMLRADVKFLKIRYGSDVKDKSGLFGARPSFLHLRTCTHVYLTRALTPYFHPESNVPLKCTPPMCSPIHSAKELAASSIRATPRLVT